MLPTNYKLAQSICVHPRASAAKMNSVPKADASVYGTKLLNLHASSQELRGCRVSQAFTFGCLWAARLSEIANSRTTIDHRNFKNSIKLSCSAGSLPPNVELSGRVESKLVISSSGPGGPGIAPP